MANFEMTINLNVLNHLGINLYSNIPAVISEVVANSYDADATKVKIDIVEKKIVISDDGLGMDEKDINEKYLHVGYRKREEGDDLSTKFKRPVMGRKGIGKLSLFSIANTIELHSIKNGELNALKMNRDEIQYQIKVKNGKYTPETIDPLPLDKGTTIVIYDLKRSSIQPKSLRKRLARRFSVINDESNFSVVVNGEPITLLDRDYFRNIQFLWPIGKPDVSQLRTFQNIYLMEPLGGTLEYSSSKAGIKVEQRYSYSGWIGTVEKPSQLNEEGTNNNKISIICRGKMAQEDVLETFPEGGIYADYLIGEITADFLDDTKEEDIATSSRQKFNEDDKRFSELRSAIYRHLKTVQSKWTKARTEGATEKVLGEFPAVKEWYDALVSDSHKTHAQKLFRTIGTLRFDDGEDEKKRTLIRSSILAFEKLKIRENLSLIDRINTADDIELISVFSELSDLEALQYYDIASNRLKVIRELKGKIQNNDLEKVLQKHIFDNLWLLNPSWERATQASEYMEQKIGTLFSEISDKLPREQREGRIDIGYRTAGGKHIIVELKRYRPSYKINPFTLAEQIDKYFSALTTCLKNSDPNLNPYIEVICIIGEFDKNYNREKFDAHLSNYNGRVYPYDQLVEEALQSYGQYLSRQQSIGKLKSIIDRI